jgi:hypothetical protein
MPKIKVLSAKEICKSLGVPRATPHDLLKLTTKYWSTCSGWSPSLPSSFTAQTPTKLAISNRLRQRRFKQRQKEPTRTVYRVEVSRDLLLNKLIDAKLIAEEECWRPRDLVEATLLQDHRQDGLWQEDPMSRERPRSTPAPMLRDEPMLIRKEHVTPRQGEEQWRAFFRHAFSEEQAGLLCEMLFNCSSDWRREWQEYALDAMSELQNFLFEDFQAKARLTWLGTTT